MKAVKYLPIVVAVILASCASSPKQAQASLSDQLAASNARADQLQSQISGLQDQLAQKTAQIDSLNAKISDLQKTNTDLSSSLAAAKASNDMESQVAALSKDKADLQAQISDLKMQNAALASAAQQGSQDLNARIAQLQKTFSKEIAQGLIDIRQYRDVLVISVKDSVFFVPDWPTLLPGGQDVLKKLAPIFKEATDRIVRVEGNTAVAPSSPASLKMYPTSWYLGAARAAAVVSFLQDQGVDPQQLVGTTFGQFRPVADNSTEQGREKNRRVDFIMVSRMLFQPDQLKEAMATTAQAPTSATVAQ
jgi:chemotaxis protein MotB